MLRDYFSLAVESLRVRQLRTWLTMIGIFIGIAAIVSLISLGQGMKAAITDQFTSLGADKVTIQAKSVGFFGPPGTNVVKPLTKDELDHVKSVNGVKRAAGRLIKPANAIFADKKSIIFMVDLPIEDQSRNLVIETIKLTMETGRFLSKADKYKVIVGNDYATKDMLGRKIRTGDKLEIEGIEFEVVGIAKKRGLPMFDLAFIANEDVMREVLDIPDEISVIAAQVSEGADMDIVAEAITKDLRRHRNEKEGKEGFEVQTPESFLNTLNTVLTVVQAVLIGIAAISLLVGGIGIMNTMYTAVLERRKEIGIMKSIGAKNSDVLLIFLIESGLLGLAGGFIGILLGIGLAKAVELIALSKLGNVLLQADFSLPLIVGALFFSFIVGVASGTLPAMQASKMQPVDALRSK